MDSIKDIELSIVNWMIQRLQEGVDKDVLQKGLSKAVTHAGQKADEVIALLKEEEEALTQRDAGLARAMEARSEINRILQVPAGAGRPYGGHDLGTLYPEDHNVTQSKVSDESVGGPGDCSGVEALYPEEIRGGQNKAPVANDESVVEDSLRPCFSGAPGEELAEMRKEVRSLCKMLSGNREFGDFFCLALVPHFDEKTEVGQSQREAFKNTLSKGEAIVSDHAIDASAEFLLKWKSGQPSSDFVKKAGQLWQEKISVFPGGRPVVGNNAVFVTLLAQSLTQGFESQRGTNSVK